MKTIPEKLYQRIHNIAGKTCMQSGIPILEMVAVVNYKNFAAIQDYRNFLIHGTQPYTSRPKSVGLTDVINWIWVDCAKEDEEVFEEYIEELETF